MKKIIFIEPKSPGFHIFSKFRLPRLGAVLLATILKEKGYQVKVFVEEICKINREDLFSADLVGISTITSTAPRAYAIADEVRNKGIPVVMGGCHPTFLPDEALEHADYVVRGEGEETLVALLEKLQLPDATDLSEIPGLSFRSNGQIKHNRPRELLKDLDVLPAPDLSLIEGSAKIGSFEKNKTVPIMSSRGCPFDCEFCSVSSMHGRGYRFRSPEKVLAEIRSMKDRYIFFYDDNFTADKARTKQLLRMMLKEKLTPPWSAQVRVDAARDKELLDLMKQTNCELVFVGFESINPKTLKSYNKGQTIDEIEESIKTFHRYGIKIHGMFVLGSDDDDVNVIRQTAVFAKKLNIDFVQFLILTPIIGSRLFDKFRAQDKIFTYSWDLYDGHHVVYKPARMTPFKLQVETMRAMAKFYSWGQVFRAFIKGKFFNTVVKIYAHRLLKKWAKRNKIFKLNLKRENYGQLGKWAASLKELIKPLGKLTLEPRYPEVKTSGVASFGKVERRD